MSTDGTAAIDEPLQFDTVARTDAPDVARPATSVRCAACDKLLTETYHSVDGVPSCARCRDAAEQAAAPVREWPLVARAGALGFGAALVGAGVYYGVIAATDYEIGLVAILCGWMVGWAVRRGAGGRGGRRLQVLAVAMTYLSIALAYLPLALKGERESHATGGAATHAASAAARPNATDSVTAVAAAADGAATDSAAPTARAGAAVADSSAAPSTGALALAIGAAILFTLALPVLSVFGSMPSGILSAIIIGVGLRQAWTMTAAVERSFRGPLRVGGGSEPA